MNNIQLLWRDKEIGTITNLEIDMWYCDCKFISNGAKEAASFIELAANFDAKEIIQDANKGTRVIVKYTETHEAINALVISLKDNALLMRYIYEETAINWLVKNVY